MLENKPTQVQIINLIGQQLYEVWEALCKAIDDKYEAERIWNNGGKRWIYEYKYRRSSKTICSLYLKENCIGFMIIFGKDERIKFEEIRNEMSNIICKAYDGATTYHDGKWVMFEPKDTTDFDCYIKMLAIKRKPNRK